MSNKWMILMLSCLTFIGSQAFAEQKFGVDVYPGATADSALTDLSKESADKMQEGIPEASRIKFEQEVYVTSDSFDKVLEFYEKIFGMKAAEFDPQNPSALKPEGFALLQSVEMKDVATSAKIFNPTLDGSKYEGQVKLALFNKPDLPMVQIVDQGLNWKSGEVIKKTVVGITKQPEMPKLPESAPEAPAAGTPTASK
ncbi:MAG: hypothetical protein HYS08_04090 [Chlamydiae bacterium]|nr:hypothetical protein [Chlamydiota bacterium]MBI3266097.1 hypothetical protein [Chlamydiota bacterium]